MPIDKVVAISRKGFSKVAHEKAAAHRIETLSMREALQADWIGKFVKLGVASVIQRFHLYQVTFETVPPVEGDVLRTHRVVRTNGEEQDEATVHDLVDGMWPEMHRKIAEYVSANFLEIHKTTADIDRALRIEKRVKPQIAS